MKLRNLYEEGDHVEITSTHNNDLHKEGIIVEKRCSFCKIQILNPDGTPELNPQNNKPVILNHTYAQFKKVNPDK
jgi:hypothetical protein